MGIMPSKTKFRMQQRNKMKGNATAGNTLKFGEIGLQALEECWLKVNQVESARKAMAHHIQRGGKIWVKVCADKPVSARPAETRMGSGKGAPAFFVACIKPGHIIFELSGVKEADAVEALRLAAYKLPIKTRVVKKK